MLISTEPKLCVCAGRNFGAHINEGTATFKNRGGEGFHTEIPGGFTKSPHVLVPHRASVARPAEVEKFDYEVEIAAVISKPIQGIPEDKALDAVFGYTVFNDLSAREWQLREMQNQMLLVGKNFPGFGPVGPWILTSDEMPDPNKMVVSLKVNQHERQHASASEMIFTFPQLIAFWSKMGFQPGDLVTSGTPSGVAIHHKPDPSEWYLRPGDVVETIVEPIGVFKTTIV